MAPAAAETTTGSRAGDHAIKHHAALSENSELISKDFFLLHSGNCGVDKRSAVFSLSYCTF